MTGPRDWDRELADIDRLIEKMPAKPPVEQPAGAPRAPGAPPTRPGTMLPGPGAGPGRRAARGQVLGTWLVVLMVVALGAFLPFWPYVNECGRGLFGYLGAVAVVVLGAVWCAGLTWRNRRPVAHLLSIVALLWGLALAAERILPRIGYAADSATWMCPAAPVAQASQSQPSQPSPSQPSQSQPSQPQPSSSPVTP